MPVRTDYFHPVSQSMDPVVALGAGVAFVCWADRCMSGAQLAGLLVVFIVMWGCAATKITLVQQMDLLKEDRHRDEKATIISARSTSLIGPHRKAPDPSDSSDPPDQEGFEHPDGPKTDPYAFPYTASAVQSRRDEFVFRKTLTHPTSASRQRMLAQMYKELLDASKKSDPALRSVEKSSADGCVPLSGKQAKPHLV